MVSVNLQGFCGANKKKCLILDTKERVAINNELLIKSPATCTSAAASCPVGCGLVSWRKCR